VERHVDFLSKLIAMPIKMPHREVPQTMEPAMATPEQTEAPAPEVPEAEVAPEPAPEAPEVPPEAPEVPPEAPEPAPEAPEVEATEEADPEPGSPRRKRPREPSLVVPRLDASFWEQLVTEGRAIREASRREQFENLMRF
jgi:hypothetical protein